MNFQTFVGTQPSPAVAGDFASANPRYSVDAGPGGLVSGPNGLFAGRFAWWSASQIDANDTPAIANNFGSGPVTGFVHREQQGLITQFLSEGSMFIPQGFNVTLMSGGDFWVINDGATEALVGQKCYANYADGKATFAATGAPGTASGSASSIAAATNSGVGSIADNILTLTGSIVGTIRPGTTISGTNVASGTQIVAQVLPLLPGEAVGGIGRYAVNIPEQTVASTAISGTYGILTVGGTVAGAFGVGDTLSGASVVAGTTITQLISGTGGVGTYAVNNNTVVSSTAITAGLQAETKWIAMSAGLPGDLIKISSQPLG
jgi:hypothetical protein